jgi:sugar-specific transcriptional regulator TrmB
LEKVYETLTGLGLSTTEAQIYVFLAQHGPQKQEQIKHKLSFGAEELTSSLVALRKKGFIEAKTYRSNILLIVPFDVVLQRLIDAKKEQINQIKSESSL